MSYYISNMVYLINIGNIGYCSMTGADQSRIMQDQISGAAMAMPADTNKAFKVSKNEKYKLHFITASDYDH